MRRPAVGVREVVGEGDLTLRDGLAGDELYVNLDLSEENLPPGARLALGSAVIEVTAQPHAAARISCSASASR